MLHTALPVVVKLHARKAESCSFTQSGHMSSQKLEVFFLIKEEKRKNFAGQSLVLVTLRQTGETSWNSLSSWSYVPRLIALDLHLGSWQQLLYAGGLKRRQGGQRGNLFPEAWCRTRTGILGRPTMWISDISWYILLKQHLQNIRWHDSKDGILRYVRVVPVYIY